MRKFLYPPIFDLCHCGCNEIVWGGYRWVSGHNTRIDNSAKKFEVRLKLSKALTGIKRSEETKQKLSEINKGKHSSPRTEFTREKLLGHITSEETKRKISRAQKGQKSHWFGKVGPHKMPHTEKTKKIISEKCKGKTNGKKNGMYGKSSLKSGIGKGSYYNSPLQDKIWLRSTYELAYAKYLDSQKILWYYEIQTFELSDEMTYTPDFFLPKYEKFIEIKGYMLPKAKIKINKFKEEYPFDLDILYKEDLIKLGLKI